MANTTVIKMSGPALNDMLLQFDAQAKAIESTRQTFGMSTAEPKVEDMDLLTGGAHPSTPVWW